MKKKKIAATVAALAMAAVTVFSVGGSPAYANENVDIAIQTETASESVVLPVSVASEAWVYSDGSREFGTWKALNIKVNDTMYPLSKDGAVNVTFSNGDEIKIYSGDSYELWEGTISISGDEVKVTSQNDKYASSGCTGTTTWGCNLVYSDGALTLSKTKNGGMGGGGVASFTDYVYYNYDLTAKTEGGTPIEGIGIKDNFIFDYSYGSNLRYSIVDSNCAWGNGNFYSLKFETIDEIGVWVLDTTRITDQNGYTDMYLPDECVNAGYSHKIHMGGNISGTFGNGRRAYISNGLVDVTINNEYYTNTAALGLKAAFGTAGTDEVLGDYYYASKMLGFKSDSVTLQDEAGKDIATVTMGLKETDDMHLIGKDGYSYKATGLEPTADIKMADGVTDWTVSVTTEDNTFHINAVKKDSESNENGNTTNNESASDKYIADLSKADSQTVSADTFATILAENATKDVVIKSNNNITFTFAKGTMASVDGKTEYDFSTSINSTYADTMPSYITKDNFVSQINFNYSGKLPATANIRFYAGTEYAGQTLYYSLMNADNTFAEVQAVVVDADGYMTVKQDHCSSYVVTKTEPKLPDNKDTKTDDGNTTVSTDKNASSTNASVTSPKTGDMTPIAIYVVMAVVAVGVIVFVKRSKTA